MLLHSHLKCKSELVENKHLKTREATSMKIRFGALLIFLTMSREKYLGPADTLSQP
jgi:hypothetical protein